MSQAPPATADKAPPASDPPALLEVDKLTLRFGGLTAVGDVDLRVNEGEIVAVIGPNGAGKTSLFNAITGIYEPTSGAVRLAGVDLREPLRRENMVRWLLSGLALGVLAMLAMANVDSLWAATIKQRGPDVTFGTVAADAVSYLWARPRIELRLGRHHVVSADGSLVFASHKQRPDAERDLLAVRRLLDEQGVVAVVDGAGGARLVMAGEPKPLLTVASRARASALLADLGKAGQAARRERWLRLAALVVGTALGIAGAQAVWQRTRRTPTSVARRGVARTFQNIRLFHNMTVLENVLVAMDRHLGHRVAWTDRTRLWDLLMPVALVASLGALAAALRKTGPEAQESGVPFALLSLLVLGGLGYLVRIGKRGAFSNATLVLEAVASQEALELLRFVGLHSKADDLSRNLAYGEQRRLEIARALATRPKLLLLDEPAAA